MRLNGGRVAAHLQMCRPDTNPQARWLSASDKSRFAANLCGSINAIGERTHTVPKAVLMDLTKHMALTKPMQSDTSSFGCTTSSP